MGLVRWMIGLGLMAALAAGDGLDGSITGGKAKKLVDEAYPLVKQGDAIYKRYVLKMIAEPDVVTELKTMLALYIKAADELQAALDIQEDSSVLSIQLRLCKRIAKARAQIFYRRPKKPRPKPRPKPGERQPPDQPGPKPEPEPVDPKPGPEPEPEHPKPDFAANKPPAEPTDARLPTLDQADDPDAEKRLKSERSAISKMLKQYYGARKQNKLHFRHRICRGKGCRQCGQTGRQINLYHFRKAFWNCYSPMLRNASGARDALKAFHRRAHSDMKALGPTIKSFKVKAVEVYGYWARVCVCIRWPAMNWTN